jgi:recombination protein RecR
MHILRSREDDVASLIQAIGDFRTGIRYCARCNNLSDNELCDICSDLSRDRSQICVVEQVGDVMSIEKTGQFRGLYHVLGGVISPMAGIAPSDLKIDLLLSNIAGGGKVSGDGMAAELAAQNGMGVGGGEARGGSKVRGGGEAGDGSGGGVPVREVILAISTTVEGETTLFYIMNRLKQFPDLKITTIARGIGFGDEIEYADELTIAHAIANRRPISQF